MQGKRPPGQPPSGPSLPRTSSELESFMEDWKWMKGLALQLTGDEFLADDVRQETWLTASRYGEWPDRGALRRVMRRILWRTKRSVARRRLREVEAARSVALPSTASLVQRAEEHRRIWDALLDLEEPHRKYLLLRFQAGQTPTEIAEKEGSLVNTVRHRIRRAVEALRERLGADTAGGGLKSIALAFPAGIGAKAASRRSLRDYLSGAHGSGKVGPVTTLVLAATLIGCILFVGLDGQKERGASVEEIALLPSGNAPVPQEQPSPIAGTSNTRNAAVVRGGSPPQEGPLQGSVTPSQATLVGSVHGSNTVLNGVVVTAQALGNVEPKWTVSASTHSDGRFKLTIPFDPAEHVVLHFQGSEYLSRAKVEVNSERRVQGRGPILSSEAGETDLGVIQLTPAGVIIGQLQSRRGEGLASAHVNLAGFSSMPTDGGAYRIAHVAPGKQTVTAQSPGQLDRSSEVLVIAKETVDMGAIQMLPGSTITGRVLDESGQGIQGARVSPRAFAPLWIFESKADGYFTIPCPEEHVCSVAVAADGYLKQPPLAVAPGTRDLHVVLEHAGNLCAFQVISNETGEPIETFGLSVRRSPGAEVPSATVQPASLLQPKPEPRPLGRTTAFARPGRDTVHVEAHGFLAGEFSVDATAATGAQILRLDPTAAWRGVLVRGGIPQVDSPIELRWNAAAVMRDGRHPYSLTAAPGSQDELVLHAQVNFRCLAVAPLVGEPPSLWMQGLFDEPDQVLHTRTDSLGRFRFDVLPRGAGRLYAEVEGLTALSPLTPIIPVRGRDLGELQLASKVRISGRIALDRPGPLLDHRILIDGFPALQATTGIDGSFVLSDVPVGEHLLELQPVPGTVLDKRLQGGPYFVRIGEMGLGDLVLPVHNLDAANVEVEVQINGQPASGGRLILSPTRGVPKDYVATEVLSDSGTRTIHMPAEEVLWVTLDHHGTRYTLPGSRRFGIGASRLELNFEAASVRIGLPLDWRLPEEPCVRITWVDAAGAPGGTQLQMVSVPAGADPAARKSILLLGIPTTASEYRLELYGSFGDHKANERALPLFLHAGQELSLDL